MHTDLSRYKIAQDRFDPLDGAFKQDISISETLDITELKNGWRFLGYADAPSPMHGTGPYLALFEEESYRKVWKHVTLDILQIIVLKHERQLS